MIPDALRFEVLEHDTRGYRPVVTEVYFQCGAGAVRRRFVEILFGNGVVVDGDVRGNRDQVRVCQAGTNIGIAEGMGASDVVNVAGVLFVECCDSQCSALTERRVDETFRQVADIATCWLVAINVEACTKLICVGLVGHDPNRA